MLPNFLIVGAAKAGSTALYYYLKQHPEIDFPGTKEPKFFSSKNINLPHNGVGDHSVDKHVINNINDYQNLFENLSGSRIGEASPDYLYYADITAPEIKSTLGDIPIIIILRNPVERAFSAYTYLVRDNREKESFRTGLDLEEKRLRNNWDFIWAYKNAGKYSSQIAVFKKYFTSVKVILLDDLRSKPQKVLSEVFEFLQVESSFNPDTSIKHNPSGQPKNLIAKYILRRDSKLSIILRENIKRFFPREFIERIAAKYLQKIKMLEEDRRYLVDYYKEEISKLESLLDTDLEDWRK